MSSVREMGFGEGFCLVLVFGAEADFGAAPDRPCGSRVWRSSGESECFEPLFPSY
jgi:hypothetical protein